MGHPAPPDLEPLPDWYGVLELTKEASASQIRTAYKRLAFQYHPDKTLDEKLKPEMTKRFTQIQEAYEVLSDSRRRKEYDEDLALETKIMEEYARQQKIRKQSQNSRSAGRRHQEEEKHRRAVDRQAEMDWRAAKSQEDDLLRMAMQAQQARKQHAADQERRKTSTTQEPDRKGREGDKRAKAEAKRVREEELRRQEELRREEERLRREEDRKQYGRNEEKRTRERKQDRGHKDSMQSFPIDDILDAEPAHFDRPEKPRDRGRPSKERLHEPSLHLPRDPSKTRDRSRSRHRDRDSDFSTREFERDRKRSYENNPRRVSTEPLHEDYLRAPIYGSPTNSYSIPRSHTYSPPSSPKLRHSNPTMHTTHNTFSTPNKGRDRTRDRPGERSRKHSEAGLFSRDSFPSSIPEDINTSLPGNRDSGYSTSSAAGTPLRPTADPRISSEKLDAKMHSGMDSKKYKTKFVPVYVTDSEGDDGTSTVRSRPSKRATKQTSRDDPLSYSAPRHKPTVELDDDPFSYMQGGSQNAQYTHKDVAYGAKLTHVHTRSNSDHSSPPDITIDFISGGMAGLSTSGHKAARHVPPVGGGPTPGLARYQTWAS
ncbi:hypothetical protein H072_6649 [Dactylellina haptotyla CBS 200.50]|uniref:J domain-containing protein n=1 Tax=Dactylellina haptotyla (strain CBS 200.50) TaxID=1284197 RepID=S8AEE9_DACHA|nr:hypothetical protein H072_6649 [Dactylellina haptotyla CBS 200.50]